MKFEKFLKSTFFTEYLHWLLLKNGLQRKYEISPVYMTKVTGLQKKKKKKKKEIGKRTHGLGWRMPAATTKVHKLNH